MTETSPPGPIVKEIILENFMSYRYARIPLAAGLNMICGPNGSGKSSILLALAVALGQTYTERSRRLSDLIRRGEDIARVTVVLNNKRRNGTKPIPSVRSDELHLSRYMKKDGTYWCEADFRTVSKAEVEAMLSRMGIDPDNMLIVMHQNMIENFSVVEPREKLRMVEEAVGLGGYREGIVEARERLSHVLSEKEATESLLERAHETLDYWSEKYERYLRKKNHEKRRGELEREHAWARCIRLERQAGDLEDQLNRTTSDIESLSLGIEETVGRIEENRLRLRRAQQSGDEAYVKLITLERRDSRLATQLELLKESTTHANPESSLPAETSGSKAKTLEEEAKQTAGEIEETKTDITRAKARAETYLEEFVDSRVRKAVLELRREFREKEAISLRRRVRRLKAELREFVREAEAYGPRVDTGRLPSEILEELRMTKARLESLSDVSSDVERMYTTYREQLEVLQERAAIATRNRNRALEELREREILWKRNVSELLSEIRVSYGEMLDGVNATGDVRLSNANDVDEAGLEILVGFKGAEPEILDAYTQSGGERTTAVMCLLLSLQRHVKSPVRAIDEFDVHMDPLNREVIMDQLMNSFQGDSSQYLVITPGQLANLREDSHVIVVQNVVGSSRVDVLE
ncbi:MAG: AAA family ATPase [Candidatus Geothermarchaeales archaeon]